MVYKWCKVAEGLQDPGSKIFSQKKEQMDIKEARGCKKGEMTLSFSVIQSIKMLFQATCGHNKREIKKNQLFHI